MVQSINSPHQAIEDEVEGEESLLEPNKAPFICHRLRLAASASWSPTTGLLRLLSIPVFSSTSHWTVEVRGVFYEFCVQLTGPLLLVIGKCFFWLPGGLEPAFQLILNLGRGSWTTLGRESDGMGTLKIRPSYALTDGLLCELLRRKWEEGCTGKEMTALRRAIGGTGFNLISRRVLS